MDGAITQQPGRLTERLVDRVMVLEERCAQALPGLLGRFTG